MQNNSYAVIFLTKESGTIKDQIQIKHLKGLKRLLDRDLCPIYNKTDITLKVNFNF